jgi:hypothetical protein
MILLAVFALRQILFQVVFLGWITFGAQKWVTCASCRHSSAESLLGEADLAAPAYRGADFYRISFALTLVPDVDCEFRNVDAVMDLRSGTSNGGLPTFVRLKPMQQTSTRAVKIKSSNKAKLSVGDTILKIGSAELGSEAERETEFERVDVQLAGFGAGTRSAGWRLRLVDSRDIPLSTEELHALVAVPKREPRFRVAAQINIKTAVDRVLTQLFLRQSQPGAVGDYTFPAE